MNAKDLQSFYSLSSALENAPVHNLNESRRLVVWSDLHMGNGRAADDFAHNASMFNAVVRDYYYMHSHELILNGDVEDLQRFRLDSIYRRWAGTFELFRQFASENRLFRTVGNHDMALWDLPPREVPLHNALRFRFKDDEIFIVHGHQTRQMYSRPNPWADFVLRYLANPLRIRNRQVSHSSQKKLKVEQRVYEFASRQKVLTIIGHTHRPLFESMSKLDSIKFQIEYLCRIYPEVPEQEQNALADRIGSLKDELSTIQEDPDLHEPAGSLYNANLVVPCMFNSGAVIGRRGMTCLEIDGDRLRLVYWFDAARSQKYLQYKRYETEQLPGTDYYRIVLKEDTLDYIFTLIKLLS